MTHYTTDRRYLLRDGETIATFTKSADARLFAEAGNLFDYIQEHEASDGVIARRLLWANEAERVLRDTLGWFLAYEPCSPQLAKIKAVLKQSAPAAAVCEEGR